MDRRGLVELGWRSAGDPAVMALPGLREVLSAPMPANWKDLADSHHGVQMSVIYRGSKMTLLFFPSGLCKPCRTIRTGHHTYANGIAAISTQVRIEPQAVWSRHKTGNRLPYRQAAREMACAGAKEGIVALPDGYLVDDTTSNLFFRFAMESIMTPPLAMGCLPALHVAKCLTWRCPKECRSNREVYS